MFSSESALERELSAAPSTTTHFDLETEQNVAFILSRGLKRAALQFPDTLLHHASTAASELELALSRTSEPVQVFVLGDTTFDGYQVDFVSAQHLAADCVIHYGPVDLDASGPLPVRLVLGRRALDVRRLVTAIGSQMEQHDAGRDGGKERRRLLIVPSLPYVHAAGDLVDELGRASFGSALVCSAELEREVISDNTDRAASKEAASAVDPSAGSLAAIAHGRILGRTLPTPLSEADLAQCDLLYIGADDSTLSNLCLLMREATVYLYGPGSDAAGVVDTTGEAPELIKLSLATAKRLMRRYCLMQKAHEAEVVGILIATLSASMRKSMTMQLKALIKAAGRKAYVFVMGKLNAAKLANFMEVGVYVLVGSCEHSLLDSKDFYRPVVTPYELSIALMPGAEWTGEYILDYGRLLPRLCSDSGESLAAASGSDRDSGDEPHFSLLTGRLISRRQPRDDGTTHEDAAGNLSRGQTTLSSSGSGKIVNQGNYAIAQSGAEYLSRRSYRGLDPRLGEHAPAQVVDGLSGIASEFCGEGSKESRFQAAVSLLDTSGSNVDGAGHGRSSTGQPS